VAVASPEQGRSLALGGNPNLPSLSLLAVMVLIDFALLLSRLVLRVPPPALMFHLMPGTRLLPEVGCLVWGDYTERN